MTNRLTQRMTEINATLSIFKQDPISIINTTFASSNQDQSWLINYTIASPSSPKRPTANHTAVSIADGRPENPIPRSHELLIRGTQPTFASPTHDQTEYNYDIENYQLHTEAAPSDLFPQLAPTNEDVKLSAPPDRQSTAYKSVIKPPTDTSVLETAVYLSHDLDVYYGQSGGYAKIVNRPILK